MNYVICEVINFITVCVLFENNGSCTFYSILTIEQCYSGFL